MCFSATASFVAGGVLTAAGVITVTKTKKWREVPLASMPLLFGVQQLIDGVVWVSLGSHTVNAFAAYGYIFFAFILWPIFVPLAVLALETDEARRRVLSAISIVGAGVGLFALYLVLSGPVTARIVNQSIWYNTATPYPLTAVAFYLVATCGSFFVSSRRFLNIFGVVIFVSSIIAWWFYFETFASVWCFFSAVLSAMIVWYFYTGAVRR